MTAPTSPSTWYDAPGPPTVAVVANACDTGDPDLRGAALETELEALRALGLEPHEVDLRDYDAETDPDATALAGDLAALAGLWVRGGNAFTLRMAMARSGADRLVPRLLADDALVYAGYSAGPCVRAPSLRGLELCDEVHAVRARSGVEPIWEGLGILDRAFVPHLDTPGHPESEWLGGVADLYRRDGVPCWALRDGQVVVVDGDPTDAVLV